MQKIARYTNEVLYVTILWVSIIILYVFFKTSALSENDILNVYSFQNGGTPLKVWLYILGLKAALPLGFSLGMFHTFVYPWFSKTIKRKFSVIIRLLVFPILCFCILLLIWSLYNHPSTFTVNGISSLLSNKILISFFIYLLFMGNIVGIILLLEGIWVHWQMQF